MIEFPRLIDKVTKKRLVIKLSTDTHVNVLVPFSEIKKDDTFLWETKKSGQFISCICDYPDHENNCVHVRFKSLFILDDIYETDSISTKLY